MKAEKNLSIKVKSKTERRIMENPEVEMITEWNIKRIVSVIIASLLIIIPAYYFSQKDVTDADKYAKSISLDNESKVTRQDSIDKAISPVTDQEAISEEHTTQGSKRETIPQPVATNDSIVLVPPVKPGEQADEEKNTKAVVTKEAERQQQSSKQPVETEYLNPHITEARLALGINKLIPYGEVDLPLFVDNTKASGIFFFTEVSNMRGSTVFHEWLKEGESIYKLKAIIRSNRSRFYTSKLFTPRSVGQWQVRIITDQGEVLHKVDFSVKNR